MKLYLVRHTQTNYNLLGLANSDPTVDVHLSERGIEQAKALRELLVGIEFDAVFISELPRTRQTASVILGDRQAHFIVDPRINDNATGYESKSVQAWLGAVAESGDPWNAKFHGGESKNEAAARAREFIDDLKAEDYNCVLVVTHGFLTQMISGYIERKTAEEASSFELPQGTYAKFDLPEGD